MGLAYGNLEGGQVEFAHGPLVDHGVGGLPAQFLTVHGEVLGGGGHSLGLDAFNQPRSHVSSHLGILRVVLEVAAAQRVALDVHTRAEHDVHTQALGLSAQRLAHGLGQVRIP